MRMVNTRVRKDHPHCRVSSTLSTRANQPLLGAATDSSVDDDELIQTRE